MKEDKVVKPKGTLWSLIRSKPITLLVCLLIMFAVVLYHNNPRQLAMVALGVTVCFVISFSHIIYNHLSKKTIVKSLRRLIADNQNLIREFEKYNPVITFYTQEEFAAKVTTLGFEKAKLEAMLKLEAQVKEVAMQVSHLYKKIKRQSPQEAAGLLQESNLVLDQAMAVIKNTPGINSPRYGKEFMDALIILTRTNYENYLQEVAPPLLRLERHKTELKAKVLKLKKETDLAQEVLKTLE